MRHLRLLALILLALLLAAPAWSPGTSDSGTATDSRLTELLQKAQKESDRQDCTDVHNLLDYNYRKLGDYDTSMLHYQKALAIDPNHRGALEYLGELYLTLKQPVKVQEMLVRLQRGCGDCEESRELPAAIEAYGQGK